MRILFRWLLLPVLCAFLMTSSGMVTTASSLESSPEIVAEPLIIMKEEIPADEEPVEEEQPQTLVYEEEQTGLSEDEIELIALVTMAEAEGECEEGKRLVIDTILNRVDSVHFPDTVAEVIYQPNQFSSMWNGRVDRCYVQQEICALVREEAERRYNSETIFFTAGQYSQYGVPMFQVGGHYFSSYE